jgi:hypothetical protein
LRQQGVDQSRLSDGVVMRVRDDRQITGSAKNGFDVSCRTAPSNRD